MVAARLAVRPDPRAVAPPAVAQAILAAEVQQVRPAVAPEAQEGLVAPAELAAPRGSWQLIPCSNRVEGPGRSSGPFRFTTALA